MSLAKKVSNSREPRLWAVSYDTVRDAYRIAMEDGRTYLLKRPIPEDDGSEILEIFLEGNGEVFTVVQSSGNEFSVPWDAVDNLSAGRQLATSRDAAERISLRIRSLRQSKGLTQTQLARVLKLARPNISRLESGKHLPGILLLQRLADALSVDLSDLIAE